MVVFVHKTLRRTFCAVYGTFCTSNSQAYILCSIQHFLHIKLSSTHFVLYTALFAHQILKHTTALFAHTHTHIHSHTHTYTHTHTHTHTHTRREDSSSGEESDTDEPQQQPPPAAASSSISQPSSTTTPVVGSSITATLLSQQAQQLQQDSKASPSLAKDSGGSSGTATPAQDVPSEGIVSLSLSQSLSKLAKLCVKGRCFNYFIPKFLTVVLNSAHSIV